MECTISVGAAVGIGEVAKYAKYVGAAIKNLGVKHTLRIVVENSGKIKFADDAGTVILHEFEGRSKLRRVLKTKKGDEAHHLIPWQFFDHPAIQKAAKNLSKPFHMNHHKNGLSLNKFRKNLDNGGVHANHPKYNAKVKELLDDLDLNSATLSEDVIEIQNFLRSVINSNSGVKINDLIF